MGTVKKILSIIVVVITITSCYGKKSGYTANEESNLANLVGIYDGTRGSGDGPVGWQIFVFKDAKTYRSAIFFYPVRGGPRDVEHSYLANIRYNEARLRFEFQGYNHLTEPVPNSYFSGTNFATWYGTLQGNVFSGNNAENSGMTFNTKKIFKSNYKYTGPHDHLGSEESVTIKEATCTAEGEKTINCIFCGTSIASEVLPMIPHTPRGRPVVVKEPTCNEEGVQVINCAVCGKETVAEAIAKLPHTVAADAQWVTVKEPLCNETGLRVKYCSVCEEEAVNEEIPALTYKDHVYKTTMIRSNIFIPPIVSENVCEICGYTERRNDFTFAWVSPSILLALAFVTFVVIRTRTFIRKKKTFVCPYCFEKSLVHNVQFRCDNHDCADEPDEKLTAYLSTGSLTPELAKKTFDAPASKYYSIPKAADCPKCNKKTKIKICPACHNTLPESTLYKKNIIISVVGSRAVGKSHFLGVLIYKMKNEVAIKFDGVMTCDDDTNKRYSENYERRLYRENTKLELTQSSLDSRNNHAYKPYIYTLSLTKKLLFIKIKRNYTLIFYDNAGEDLTTEANIKQVNKNICNASGIIFLLDPLQLKKVRTLLFDNTDDKTTTEKAIDLSSPVSIDEASNQDDIMARVSRVIRNNKDMESTKMIKIPVAAVFSKLDVIKPIVPKNMFEEAESPHYEAQAFVTTGWEQAKADFESMLNTWEAPNFIRQLEDNYTDFSYFAVSALGLNNNPQDDGRIERPRPYRVDDPLLWILKENKVIKSKK